MPIFLAELFVKYKTQIIGTGIILVVVGWAVFNVFHWKNNAVDTAVAERNYYYTHLPDSVHHSTTFTPQTPTTGTTQGHRSVDTTKYIATINALLAHIKAMKLDKDSTIAALLAPQEAVIPDTTVKYLWVEFEPIMGRFNHKLQLKDTRVDSIFVFKYIPPDPPAWYATPVAYFSYGLATIPAIYELYHVVVK